MEKSTFLKKEEGAESYSWAGLVRNVFGAGKIWLLGLRAKNIIGIEPSGLRISGIEDICDPKIP